MAKLAFRSRVLDKGQAMVSAFGYNGVWAVPVIPNIDERLPKKWESSPRDKLGDMQRSRERCPWWQLSIVRPTVE